MSGRREPLARVPERAREWHTGEAGEVRVLEPRYGRSALGRLLARKLGKPYIEIRLDALGGAVWEACDGRSSAREIARSLRARFGAGIEPAEERVGRFLDELARARLIRWNESPASHA